MESLFFIFDGKKSSDMGLYSVRIGGDSFVRMPIVGSTSIDEEQTKKRLMPNFYGVTREPIQFTLQFALADKHIQPKDWSPQKIYEIAKWLIHDTYKEFQTADDLGKRYYAICVDDTDLYVTNSKGYIELTFRTNSPFAWSPIYIEEFDLSSNIGTSIIELENRSNVLKYYNPKIEIELIGDTTDIQIKNLSNGGQVMKFENLTKGEIISIDCENRIIKSNLFDSNPFAKFNVGMQRYWCDLVFGVNQIQVEGRCIIRIKSQFPIAQ